MTSISNSEIESFLRCRRMWDYSSLSRKGLRSLNPTPHSAFHVGAVVHQALEAQVSLGHRPNVEVLIDKAEEELEDFYRSIVGTGWSKEERDRLMTSRQTILGVTKHYFDYYGSENPLADLNCVYKHAELTFEVPIPGTEHTFKGTIDGIAEHDSGEVFLVEHKTTSMGFPSATDLQIGRQLQAYVWASRSLLGKPVAGIIYDGISKKVPSVPSLTQAGLVSRAVITTTPEIFRMALKANNQTELGYEDILAKLDSQSPFFQRHVIKFTNKALDLFGEQLKQIVTDMTNPDLPLYPNRVWQGCWDCHYQELCTSQQLGEDYEVIMDLKYTRESEARNPSGRNKAVRHLNIEED